MCVDIWENYALLRILRGSTLNIINGLAELKEGGRAERWGDRWVEPLGVQRIFLLPTSNIINIKQSWHRLVTAIKWQKSLHLSHMEIHTWDSSGSWPLVETGISQIPSVRLKECPFIHCWRFIMKGLWITSRVFFCIYWKYHMVFLPLLFHQHSVWCWWFSDVKPT